MEKINREREWGEISYGARWPNTPSPYRYQMWQMECRHCEFCIEPSSFRRYSEFRKDHPEPYGNMASISHARKVMREHLAEKHPMQPQPGTRKGKGRK